MYRLCIFDLDGTLLNTVYALTYVTNLTLDAFGLRHVTPEETKRIVGNGYRMQTEPSFNPTLFSSLSATL